MLQHAAPSNLIPMLLPQQQLSMANMACRAKRRDYANVKMTEKKRVGFDKNKQNAEISKVTYRCCSLLNFFVAAKPPSSI